MKTFVPSFVVVLLFSASAPLDAAEKADVEKLLKREIVGRTLPLAEVQRYCETRVPPMPQVDSPEQWQAEADRLRKEMFEKVVFRGEAARWRDAKCRVDWQETIDGGPGYKIRKVRYEALPDMWISALLYIPDKLEGKVPAILNLNGHGRGGKHKKKTQILCANEAKRGMLALNIDNFHTGQLHTHGDHHHRSAQLDLCGTSGVAPFYLQLKRAIDLLVALEHTDPKRVAVTGLSGGGWATIYIAALDPRVALACPVAGYSSFATRARHLRDLGDNEQAPNDMATMADYTHLTAMVAPRPLLLTYNVKDDCCFQSGYALQPLVDAAKPIYQLLDVENRLRTHVNYDPGTHNYQRDNREAFLRMVGEFFFPNDNDFDATEIPSDDEVKPAKELYVSMPRGNENFHSLAKRICRSLPRDAELPGENTAAIKWQQDHKEKLRKLVRAEEYQVHAIEYERVERGQLEATFWRLQLGSQWTVPAVELNIGKPNKTALLICDRGRANSATEAIRLLKAGYRVVAVDPLWLGECSVPKNARRFALHIAAHGGRLLGIQASQTAAVARWLVKCYPDAPVTIASVGERTSVIALVAAALEEEAIAGVTLHQPLRSLKKWIGYKRNVHTAPEMWCFGLLKHFDVKQIAALVAPRPLEVMAGGKPAGAEWFALESWRGLLDDKAVSRIDSK